MKHFTSLLFLLVGVLAISPTSAQDLEISLNLAKPDGQDVAKIEFEETFEVILKNVSNQQINIPDQNSLEGLRALSFSIRDRDSGETFDVHRNPPGQSTDPQVLTIQPGESVSLFPGFAFDRWGQTKWRNVPPPNFPNAFEIAAKFQFDPNGCKQEFWIGKVQSPSVPFKFVFGRAKLPQQYLWNGFPNAALKLLKASPDLVNKRDEDSRTPLHVAVRFNHEDVVRWLVANDADVNVEAYNKFTPLYMAHMSANPKIYKLLLEAGADPNHENVTGKSPLQTVVVRLANSAASNPGRTPGNNPGRNPAGSSPKKHIQKWNEILDVFIDHGIELDLISAIRLGKEQLVEKMLQDNPELLDRFVSNQQPLRTAVKNGRRQTAQYLIEKFPTKTDVDNFAGGSGYPVSMSALKQFDLLQLLIDNGADLERRISWQGARTGVWIIGDNATLLHFAARDGTPETIKLLLDNQIDPFAEARNDSGKDEQTALEVATIFGRAENFLAMLNHPSVQKKNSDAKLAILEKCLFLVCRGGFRPTSPEARASILKALMEQGADKIVKENGAKLIQIVTQNIGPSTQPDENLKQVVRLLQEAGSEMDFFSAVAIQDTQTVDRMLTADSSLCEARRVDGYPTIHFAVQCGNLEMVKKLLAAGCDIELRNHSKNRGHFGGRMLHAAAFWNQPEIAKYLLGSGANVNVMAKLKTTPLHLAARGGNREVTKILLENGADVFAEDIRGRSALDSTTSPEVKKLLNDWIQQHPSNLP